MMLAGRRRRGSSAALLVTGGAIAVALLCCLSRLAGAADLVPADAFATLHALVKPTPIEQKWERIPWLTSLWEARKRAAAEGKPILLYV
jgi:hypothetical protein